MVLLRRNSPYHKIIVTLQPEKVEPIRSMKRNIKIISTIIIAFLLLPHLSKAQDSTADSIAATERDDFVTASLLIGSPLKAIWSVFGHATLRMECPTYDLDLVFTFESDTDVGAFMTGVAGKAKAKYVAVPAEEYIEHAREEGRELRQYELNLTVAERKELWRRLDEEMMAGAYRHFNLLYTNCVSTTVGTVQQSLKGEHLEWGPQLFEMTKNDGDFFRHTLRDAAWAEFMFITFIGTAYDHHSPLQSKLSPENVIPMLSAARIVDDNTDESRPALRGEGKIILPKGKIEPGPLMSPTLAFGLLLLLTLLVTVAERWLKWRRIGIGYDTLLFTAQTLVFALLIYMTFVSELFPGHWNWYIIPFLPVPLLLWALERKGNTARWWLAYSIVLAVFICCTPLHGSLDLPHQLITASLLVRSLNRYLLLNY